MSSENRMRIWVRIEQGERSIEKEVEVDVGNWVEGDRLRLLETVFKTRIVEEE